MKINLGATLVLSFLVVAVIVIGIGCFFLYAESEKILKNEVYDHLDTATKSRADHIKTYLEAQKKEVDLMSTSIVIREFLAADKNATDYKTKKEKAQQRLDEAIKTNKDYEEIFLIDPAGFVVLSTNSSRIGTNKTTDSFFTEGKEKTTIKDVYYSEVTLKPQLGVSSPVIDSQKNLLGVYAVRINLEKLNNIVTENTGLGKTGEILILNENSYMITPSKYIENTVLSLKIDTELSRKCMADIKEYGNENGDIEEHEETVMIYKDYRNVLVIGTHDYALPQAKWCVISKIDETEAIGNPSNELLQSFILVGVILIILTSLTIHLVSVFVSKQIIKLTTDVERISKGDLSIQLKKSNITEIQELNDSLSRVLASMKLAILRSGLTKEQIGIGEAIAAKKEAEEKFSAIAENAKDAIVMADDQDRIVFWNKAATEMFGYDAEEVMGKELHNFFPANEEHKNKKENLHSFGETGKSFVVGKTFELPVKKRNGEIITIQISISSVKLGDKWHAIGIMRDISERKKMEEAMQRFKILYDSSQDAIMTIEPPTWKFTAGNSAAIKMFAAKDEKEFTSKGPWDLSPKTQPDGKPSAQQAKEMIEKAMKEGTSYFNWTHKRLNGQNFPATVLLSRFKIGEKEALQATVREINKDEKIKEELKQSEDRYKNLFENARDGIVILDLKAKILEVNKRIEEYGYNRNELIGKNQLDYVPKKYWPKIIADNAKTAKGEPTEGEIELITPKGNVLVEYHTSPIIENDKAIGGQVILRDISEKKTNSV